MTRKKMTHNFGHNCRLIREFIGMTIAELAKKSGITQAAISQIENGLRDPQLTSAIVLSRALGAKLDRLVGDTPAGAEGGGSK